MPTSQIDPLAVFASAFAVSAFAGLAALLRSGRRVGIYSIASDMLNTGCLGLAISLIWYARFKSSDDAVYCMIGICLLAGLSGSRAINIIAQYCKRGGIVFEIRPPTDPDELPEDPVSKE